MDNNQLKVFITHRESKCDECGDNLGDRAWIVLRGDKDAACLTCADLDHLVSLPSGDAALTRRSRKNSRLSAVVLKWSKARKRYERQGLLVDSDALEHAEQECSADAKLIKELQELYEAIEVSKEKIHENLGYNLEWLPKKGKKRSIIKG
jgi:hypothetical protein